MANDHYVPQFYLRNFSSSKDKVFEYSRKSESPVEKWIREAASEENYYDYKTKDGGQETLEGVLGMAESQAAPIIKKIIQEKKFELDKKSKEYGQLIYFIALLAVRGPAHKYKMEQMESAFAQTYMDIITEDKDSFLKIAKEANPKTTKKEWLEALESYKKGELIIMAEFPDKSPMDKTTLTILNRDIFPILLTKNWAVATTNTTRKFITSDNPVNVTQFEGRRLHGFEYGFIFFPLSPDTALIGFDKELKDVCLNREQVLKANYDQMIYSHSHIYSSLISKDTQNDFNSTKFGEGQKIEVVKPF